MKKITRLKFAFFMIAAFGLSAAAQNDNRQRVIVGATPAPKPTASPVPTPKPNVSPTPVASNRQTIFDLQAKIRQSLLRPELRRGSVGIKVAALDSGRVIFEESAEKYFMPASNMKSFTVAAALEKLSPNYRFLTSVFANSQPDASGTIKGDLTVFGRGDVSFSTAFYDKDYYRGLDILADKIVAAGVKRVEGNLVGDESYFTGSPIPASWEWDDLQWYYGAEVSALPLNDNALDLSVKPSGAVGNSCIVNLLPFNTVMRIINTCRTSATGEKRDLTIKKDLDQNVLEISGTMPVGDKAFADSVTVSRPAELFVSLLKQRLAQKGVVVTGQTRVIGAKEKAILATSQVAPVEIARHESAPFSVIAAKTMKPSQNLYTETILWTLGEQGRSFAVIGETNTKDNPFFNPKSTSSQRGIFVVRNFLNEVGIAPDGVIQWDGSGLSRHNLVTPAALLQLYTFMAKQSKYSSAWLDSLTVGGVDGTLRNRFKGTRTSGNVRGKTGTIDQVSALSGYVTSATGEKIVFSIIVNGVADGRQRVATIDEIVSHLANYDGTLN